MADAGLARIRRDHAVTLDLRRVGLCIDDLDEFRFIYNLPENRIWGSALMGDWPEAERTAEMYEYTNLTRQVGRRAKKCEQTWEKLVNNVDQSVISELVALAQPDLAISMLARLG